MISPLKYFYPHNFIPKLLSSHMFKRVFLSSLWGLFGTSVSRLIVMASMILAARLLGQSDFGQFSLIQTTLGVAGVLAGAGLGATATRFVAQYLRSDLLRAGGVVALIYQISLVTVSLTLIIMIYFSDNIADSLLKTKTLKNEVILGSLLVALLVMSNIQSGLISAFERFDLIAKLNIIESLVSILFMSIFINKLGISGAILGLILGSLSSFIIGLYITKNLMHNFKIRLDFKKSWENWAILQKYSLPNLLSNLVALPVLWLAMTWVVKEPFGFSELGIYNAAYQWHGPIIFIPMILMSVSIPILVEHWENGDRSKFRLFTMRICGFTFIFAFIPAILVSFASVSVMGLYGTGFEKGWLILVLLMSAAPFHAVAKIMSGALLSMNQAWWLLGANFFWGIILLGIARSLLPTMGIKGLAIAFLISYVVLSLVLTSLVLLKSKISINT